MFIKSRQYYEKKPEARFKTYLVASLPRTNLAAASSSLRRGAHHDQWDDLHPDGWQVNRIRLPGRPDSYRF
jgi:hypothetical protein